MLEPSESALQVVNVWWELEGDMERAFPNLGLVLRELIQLVLEVNLHLLGGLQEMHNVHLSHDRCRQGWDQCAWVRR